MRPSRLFPSKEVIVEAAGERDHVDTVGFIRAMREREPVGTPPPGSCPRGRVSGRPAAGIGGPRPSRRPRFAATRDRRRVAAAGKMRVGCGGRVARYRGAAEQQGNVREGDRPCARRG
ncbi:MAG: hypothetical protein AVDCRST_MAG19-4439 [uncultured Thermomicrobiales bacterium]|uniref:Uncharacterized protein n=1 Tax=uncultured Thermomicrobiales bacterium TaxID=1645740 RepID=A0A6J4VPS6_9BACT|nr:MAG: hypothetical protein AVDCRST_MAG19-4439 [uncultured Thermomicrobiales bacterium]